MDVLSHVVGDMNRFVKREAETEAENTSSHVKRSKLSSNDNHKPGSILRVKVKNFTTYSYAEFHLSPHLNMIIGPNGTGKSTLVAAICLGLGGKIDLIKRNDMKSMIRTGQSESSIEIEIKSRNGEENYKIKRQFNASKSVYYINEIQSDERNVRKICSSLSIQLDNLCHFLPQERVAEFAKLTPEKLLIEVQRTVGTGELLDQHESLMEIDSERTVLNAEIERNEKELDDLLSKKEKLEEAVKKFKEYMKKSKDLEDHQKLLPYAQLQDQRIRITALKQARDEAKEKLASFNDSAQPFKDAIDHFNRELNEYENSRLEIFSTHTKLKDQIDKIYQKIAEYDDRIQELNVRKVSLLSRAEKKKSDLAKAKEEKVKVQDFLKNLEVPDMNHLTELKNAREKEHQKKRDLMGDENEMSFNITHLQADVDKSRQKISDLKKELTSKDKISVLDSNTYNMSFQKCKKAVLYLRGQEQFEKMYYEPPLLCVDVTNKAYSRCLEKLVDTNTQLAFTAVSKGAYDELSKELFDIQKINVPFRYTGNKDIRPRYTKEELKKLGFDGFMSDFVTGPEKVIRMMCEQNNIHQIPISLRPLDPKQLESLKTPDQDGQIRFMKLIAGDQMYQFSRSNYGNRQIMYRTEYLPKNSYSFGSGGISEERKSQVETQIINEETHAKKQSGEIEILKQKLALIKSEFRNHSQKYDELVESIKRKNDAITSYTKNKTRLERFDEIIKNLQLESQRDFSDEIKKCNGRIGASYKKKLDMVGRLSDVISNISESTIELSKTDLMILDQRNKLLSIEALIRNLTAEKEKLQKEYVQAKEKYNAAKNSDLSLKIKEQTATFTEEERDHLSVLAKHYLDAHELTESVIKSKIQLIKNDLELSNTADRSSVQELKRHLNSIEEAEKIIPALKSKKIDMEERIEKIRCEWEPKLDSLIKSISDKFSIKFTAVASAGYVEIKKEELFKDWRLEILVKFRDNSDFKVLDAHSQSGGERAVSIIFFMMCLQGLTEAPFRVVDEINQGMDPRNERLAHKNLVHTACESSTSQYFLVTPKLLTGLYYHPKMKIHCIYTGSIAPVDEDSEMPDFMDMTRSS